MARNEECLFSNKMPCEFFAFSWQTLFINNNRNNTNHIYNHIIILIIFRSVYQ